MHNKHIPIAKAAIMKNFVVVVVVVCLDIPVYLVSLALSKLF